MKFIEILSNEKEYIEQIIKIEERIFGKNGGVDYWILKPIIRYGKVLAIEENNKILAVAELINNWDNNTIYIYGFCVDIKYQSKGIGKVFLEKLKEYIIKNKKTIKNIVLTVDKENIKAIKLYEKLGFEIEKELKDEYGKGIDRLYMMFKI
ncbi:ribosomal protein S18 acetylase RimI-like enzyme [Hypnocyclicus thermotrophus]|uniref:Ribosomal protein S18 acetylase RimI-like enzyme n=1 Tax=Hypnocyclicus thermotrophus TaxID=1627895 RepID=A0AA46I5N6_9FUSO|nr:N-acetyltransferase [Hypnocyclicus thermotrophus]TDT70627.1 ribosomal protein S18 acetylase RimI-like enzyme [Hypnocyclicus thermotrophus]